MEEEKTSVPVEGEVGEETPAAEGSEAPASPEVATDETPEAGTAGESQAE